MKENNRKEREKNMLKENISSKKREDDKRKEKEGKAGRYII